MNLYLVMSEEAVASNEIEETHKTVLAVANDDETAREIAKTKWDEASNVRVKYSMLIKQVDGFIIKLAMSKIEGDIFDINEEQSLN